METKAGAGEPEALQPKPPMVGMQDWYLEHLVRLANESASFSLGITLVVGGALITGQLVGGAAYFAAIGDALAATSSDPVTASRLRDIFGGVGSKLYEGTFEPYQPVAYIHLRDAQVFHSSGGPLPSTGGTWWRGRIGAVEGFMIGSLKTAPGGEKA